MCGLAGMMTRDGRLPDPATLDRLMAALRHRGPDAAGQHVAGDVALVHTRLSIVDLQTGDQPLFGERGLALVANAEIYNDPALRAAMPEVAFRTRSDCEPALPLYAAHGLGFARHLRGMYALALHDPARRRLVLARDPFGIKPLYYVEASWGFAFASEPQALLRAGLARAEIDPGRRAELLQLKFTTGAPTIFPGIFRVLPGETLAVEGGRIVAHERLDAPAAAPPGGTLDAVLTESVAAHLRSDVPYGLFLSGGIDSAALLWLMHRATGERVQAITIGYDGSDASDESEGALAVARAVGARCERIAMTEADFWNFAPRVAAALEDPTTDAAALPTWLLGRAAGGQLKVTLCGEGGDEMFAGYGRYRRTVAPWRFVQRPPRTGGVFQDVAGLALDGWRVGLGAAERQAAVGRGRLSAMQALDCAEWLPNDLLVKLDRCLMAHGVEGRTPFVDPLVAAFALALPDRCKVDWRRGKLVLRRWLAERLPQAEPFAKKRGFKPPIGRWMAARGEALARLVAGAPGIAAFAAPEAVGRVFARGEAQARWSLLFYALWHAHHVLGVDAGASVAEVLAAAGRRG
jgi:asparagine synthase (glutamine-hydrolysing)